MIKYNSQKIERKWQKRWETGKFFEVTENQSLKKAKEYILNMFPYPSGSGLHVGHVLGWTASDVFARAHRMQGNHVLYPMGFDAFGLPAENYAIKTKTHPAITTRASIKNFTRQLKSLGISCNWSRVISTCDPTYYKWTQWLFLQLYKNGLAYRKKALANWCPSCKTVLANEQVVDGACERCKSEVVQKDLEQWFFRITEYADRLLADLDKIDWPEKIKEMQKNWIGKSDGVIINFKGQATSDKRQEPSGQNKKLKTNSYKLKAKEYDIPVFTTRPDTIFGVTYLVLAPEHPLVQELVSDGEREAVAKYISETFKKTELERTGLKKDPSTGLRGGKTGVPIGAAAVNPLTGEKVSIWIADYVLYGYGTGAVMGVPAHDERDFEFASKYGLDIKYVIAPPHETEELRIKNKELRAYIGEGYLVNSDEFSGLTSSDGRQKILSFIESKGLGSRQTNYHLRDWLVSRQRYWGAPIPIIYCRNCAGARTSMHSAVPPQRDEGRRFGLDDAGDLDTTFFDGIEYAIIPVPEKDLPVTLPNDVDFKPMGESPLSSSKSFHRVICPRCGNPARRESDTMDTFVDSSWYFLRYTDPVNTREFANQAALHYWNPVDWYIGGAEHAVLHLLYARFSTKVLYDLKFLNHEEPFLRLRSHGLILGEDGQKMSKSIGNIVNPDDVMKEHGADTLRMYELFMGAYEDSKPWSTGSIKGVRRFLDRVWLLQEKVTVAPSSRVNPPTGGEIEGSHANKELERLLHRTIKKVTEDIENFKFNTAISAMMILTNAMYGFVEAKHRQSVDVSLQIPKEWFEQFILLLSPFAPHICEEIWENLGHKNSIVKELWPVYDDSLVKDDEINLVVQVNGKVRDTIRVAVSVTEEEAKHAALASANVKKYLEGKKVQKVIFVPGKLINFVV